MGGNNPNSKIVSYLCIGAHDKIDNSVEWSNSVLDGVYRIFDYKNNTLLRRDVGAALVAPGKVASTSEGEQDDDVRDNPSVLDVVGNARAGVPVLQGVIPEELTKSECIAHARRLRAEKERNPWDTGDLLNAAERLDDTDNSWDYNGESLLDILAIQPETASNYQRVCRVFDVERRVHGLTFGHHAVVYRSEDRENWLRLAKDEGLSVSELRRRVRPPKPAAKRFTIEQLRERALIWGLPATGAVGPVYAFLDWLAEGESR
jgi:hypothetical protein